MNKKLESTEAVYTHTHNTFYRKNKEGKNIAFVKDIYITDQLLI